MVKLPNKSPLDMLGEFAGDVVDAFVGGAADATANAIKFFNGKTEANQYVDVILDYLGIKQPIDDLNNSTLHELDQLRANVINASRQIGKAYKTFVEEVAEIPPAEVISYIKDEGEAALLSALQDQQTKFSKWLQNYAPFSTAKRKVQETSDALQSKIKEASDAVDSLAAKNQEIAQANEKIMADYQNKVTEITNAVNKRNAENRAKIDAYNQKLDNQAREADLFLNQIDTLRNMSGSSRNTNTWKQLKDNVVADANQFINQIKGDEKE